MLADNSQGLTTTIQLSRQEKGNDCFALIVSTPFSRRSTAHRIRTAYFLNMNHQEKFHLVTLVALLNKRSKSHKIVREFLVFRFDVVFFFGALITISIRRPDSSPLT